MTKIPDCPRCGSPQLSAFRADVNGIRWCECSSCNAIVLVDADGTIQRTVPVEPDAEHDD